MFSYLKINLELLTNLILERNQTRINCLSHNHQYMVLKVALSHEALWLESADVVCNITAATHDNSHQDNGINTEGLCTIYILLQYLLYLWVQVCWWVRGGVECRHHRDPFVVRLSRTLQMSSSIYKHVLLTTYPEQVTSWI